MLPLKTLKGQKELQQLLKRLVWMMLLSELYGIFTPKEEQRMALNAFLKGHVFLFYYRMLLEYN